MGMGMHGCQHHHFMGMGMHGKMGMMHHGKWVVMLITKVLKMKDELKLNDDQLNKLKSIRADFVRNAMKLKADITIAKLDMMDAFSMKDPDFNQLRTATKNIMNMKTEKKMALIDAFEKSSKVLTPDQKTKFRDMMCQWMGKGEEGAEGSE